MFVKEAYEKRLKKQEQDYTRLLTTKPNKPPKIGSIRNDKINYDKEQQFFSKDDVPVNAKTIKEQVKHFVDPDHLGLRKKQWNTSVSVPKNFEKQQTHEQKLLKIKLGFTDQPEPKRTEPLLFAGTDTRNDYTNWNVSVQIQKRQIRANLYQTTNLALQNSKLKQEKLLKSYADPLSKTTVFIEAAKQKIQSQADLRQRLKDNYIFENPTASQEKINAAVHRLAYETTIKDQKDQIAALAMNTDFKANLSLTQKGKIEVQWNHTGVWQRFGPTKLDEGDQTWAWSCCMNEDKNSRGCSHRIVDKNKWNIASFNNA